MNNIPYHDTEATNLENSGEWLSAIKRWQKVITLRPGNASWVQQRIEYCLRKMVTKPSVTESYSYDSYSYV